jgi:hypothetical protein
MLRASCERKPIKQLVIRTNARSGSSTHRPITRRFLRGLLLSSVSLHRGRYVFRRHFHSWSLARGRQLSARLWCSRLRCPQAHIGGGYPVAALRASRRHCSRGASLVARLSRGSCTTYSRVTPCVFTQQPQRLTRRCSEQLRSVTACAAHRTDPPTTDPLTAPSSSQPAPAAFARTGCASPPPSLSLGSLGVATRTP